MKYWILSIIYICISGMIILASANPPPPEMVNPKVLIPLKVSAVVPELAQSEAYQLLENMGPDARKILWSYLSYSDLNALRLTSKELYEEINHYRPYLIEKLRRSSQNAFDDVFQELTPAEEFFLQHSQRYNSYVQKFIDFVEQENISNDVIRDIIFLVINFRKWNIQYPKLKTLHHVLAQKEKEIQRLLISIKDKQDPKFLAKGGLKVLIGSIGVCTAGGLDGLGIGYCLGEALSACEVSCGSMPCNAQTGMMLGSLTGVTFGGILGLSILANIVISYFQKDLPKELLHSQEDFKKIILAQKLKGSLELLHNLEKDNFFIKTILNFYLYPRT